VTFRPFGVPDGRQVYYFHGTPGAPDECAIFDAHAKDAHLSLLCADRMAVNAALDKEAYFQLLSDQIATHAETSTIDIVGFSIGAFVALQVARRLGGRVRQLHLISPAAPLEAGDFIEQAAGKPVFRLAMSHPDAFLRLAQLQGLVAGIAPRLVFRMMFASARGGDMALARDPAFRAFLAPQLRACLADKTRGYWRDICAYVQPWQATLADIETPTMLWHGTEDNWSPVAMAHHLNSAIPGAIGLEVFPGLSHYSCLYRAAPAICQRLRSD
jgi:pimeloyl-ACP methyl ester carboxylesterase